MRLSHAAQSGAHPYAERGLDCYETPACAVEALLQVELLPRVIWEPAAGRGAIANVLRAAGHEVLTSDIIDYGGLDFIANFLSVTEAPPGCAAIVTNPPYKLAAEFVAHALKLVPFVMMLLRLAFIESERRSPILDTGTLARVHVFRNRLPFMHRDLWVGPRSSSAICFGWFRWDRNHHGATTIDRISWKRLLKNEEPQ